MQLAFLRSLEILLRSFVTDPNWVSNFCIRVNVLLLKSLIQLVAFALLAFSFDRLHYLEKHPFHFWKLYLPSFFSSFYKR